MASTPHIVKRLAAHLGICDAVSKLDASQRYLLALAYALATLPLPTPWSLAINVQGELVYTHKR